MYNNVGWRVDKIRYTGSLNRTYYWFFFCEWKQKSFRSSDRTPAGSYGDITGSCQRRFERTIENGTSDGQRPVDSAIIAHAERNYEDYYIFIGLRSMSGLRSWLFIPQSSVLSHPYPVFWRLELSPAITRNPPGNAHAGTRVLPVHELLDRCSGRGRLNIYVRRSPRKTGDAFPSRNFNIHTNVLGQFYKTTFKSRVIRHAAWSTELHRASSVTHENAILH